MTDDERRVLVKYHAKLIVRWIEEPNLASKKYLIQLAERALELLKELESS